MPKSTLNEGDTLTQPATEGTRPAQAPRRPYPKRESEDKRSRRPSGTVAISIVLHVVVGAALLRVLMMPYPFISLFGDKEEPIQPERISFLALPQTEAAPTPGRSGGNNRPETPTRRAAPPIAAPTEVPSAVPPANPAAPPTPTARDEGTGPLVGRGGPTKGIRPSYSDPRIWVPDAPVVSAPKSADARMDSTVAAGVERARDSAAAVAYNPSKFERGDWTVEKNGRKYGMDTEYLRLGKVSIPLPLLALLPMNLGVQGNPVAAERERAMASMRADIQYHSQRALNEQEFRKAVKSLRERKEREVQEKARQKPIAEEARPATPVP